MPTFDPFSVVTVPFPFVERDGAKRRPALLVGCSNSARVEGEPELGWVLMITGAGKQRWADDIDVENIQQAGLRIPSIVRVAKIATVELSETSVIGSIAGPTLDRVRDALRHRLHL